jgi:glycosyltransferase involved in cell wall biosynthesis
MSVIKRHTDEPTFEERMHCLFLLHDYMNSVLGHQTWFLVDSTSCSIPDHFHFVATDEHTTDPEEEELFSRTPKIRFPLHGSVLIGIPAHDEADYIGRVVREATKYGEVLVYCDDCQDQTPYLAHKNGANYVIEGEARVGYGGALQYIFKYARDYQYDTLVILDGDGQHDPKQIPEFLRTINIPDIDLVIGNRFLGDHNTPTHRQLVIKAINGIINVGDSQCGFRAYNREAIEKIKIVDQGMGASLDILNQARRAKLNISEIPCNILYEDTTEHTYNTFEHGKMLFDTIFWLLVWQNPSYYLGGFGTLFGILGIWWLVKMVYLYRTINSFATGLAIVGVGAMILCMLLFMSMMYILVAKRQMLELKKYE